MDSLSYNVKVDNVLNNLKLKPNEGKKRSTIKRTELVNKQESLMLRIYPPISRGVSATTAKAAIFYSGLL
jgi:hypothetical protein